ncbi:MAG: SMP-30/gluconolactonase/LRE family protein [Kiritimatiellae bacterium]|nr:SMP-30/gluconolactonase/LRE family protein [Kiritimatiellia bacterium]
MTVKLFSDSACTVAEGPRWNGPERTLYWVDITAGEVLRQRFDVPMDGFERFAPGLGKIGAVEFAPDGRLLLFTERCEVYISDFGGVPELKWTLSGHGDTRFNDVLDAGDGVFFCGVAPIRPSSRGELWRLDTRTGEFACVESETKGMPNGMGLSPDRRTMYFVVSDERVLYAYDFDDVAKAVSGRRVVCRDFAEPGVPDGMCIDPNDGNLYVAIWNGSRLERRTADGALVETIRFPMATVTSACIGEGCVFVTTGNLPRSDAECSATKAGGVFVLRKEEHANGTF